jgi:ATP adenylyltransferase
MAYIDGIHREVACFLCAAVSNCADDARNLVVWRTAGVICVMNHFPYNSGHLMVAPCRHGGELAELSASDRAALLDGVVSAKALLEKTLKPHGFNIGLNLGRAAGAGLVDHLHFHVVPRWDGDTNFMPVLADTKVMPQSLSGLYAKLKGAL